MWSINIRRSFSPKPLVSFLSEIFIGLFVCQTSAQHSTKHCVVLYILAEQWYKQIKNSRHLSAVYFIAHIYRHSAYLDPVMHISNITRQRQKWPVVLTDHESLLPLFWPPNSWCYYATGADNDVYGTEDILPVKSSWRIWIKLTGAKLQKQTKLQVMSSFFGCRGPFH